MRNEIKYKQSHKTLAQSKSYQYLFCLFAFFVYHFLMTQEYIVVIAGVLVYAAVYRAWWNYIKTILFR